MEAAQRSDAGRASGKPYYLAAEIDPPKGTNLEGFLQTAMALKGRVDAIRVTDSEHAIMRMSPLAPCLALKDRGFTPVMVLNGRDRNRISFQGDLLAASALGITDIVIRQGHDPAEGDQPVARSSGDLDLPVMVKCAGLLNAGKDLAGEPLDGATALSIGVSLELSDDASRNREQAESIRRMRDLGVSSVSLGPTYDINIIEQFLPVAEETGVKLYLSVMLLKSVTMIRYLNNLKGVPSVPQEYLKKMMDAPVKQDAGLTIGAEFIREVGSLADGVVLLAIGWQDRLPEMLDLLGR